MHPKRVLFRKDWWVMGSTLLRLNHFTFFCQVVSFFGFFIIPAVLIRELSSIDERSRLEIILMALLGSVLLGLYLACFLTAFSYKATEGTPAIYMGPRGENRKVFLVDKSRIWVGSRSIVYEVVGGKHEFVTHVQFFIKEENIPALKAQLQLSVVFNVDAKKFAPSLAHAISEYGYNHCSGLLRAELQGFCFSLLNRNSTSEIVQKLPEIESEILLQAKKQLLCLGLEALSLSLSNLQIEELKTQGSAQEVVSV